MRTTIEEVLLNLKDTEQAWFKVGKGNYSTFYNECRENGIDAFFTGDSFEKEDVSPFMAVNKDHTVGHISAMDFFISLNQNGAYDLEDHHEDILHIDYAKMLAGEAYIMHADKKRSSLNGQPMSGRVLVINKE